MDTDNDLEEINVLDIHPGQLIRAVKPGPVTVEGRVHSKHGNQVYFGNTTAFSIIAPGWKFYKVYDGSEVNRG